MKNVIVGVLAFGIAILAQASSFRWSNAGMSSSSIIYQSDGATVVKEGVAAYLIGAAETTQSDLLTAARGENFNLASYAVPNSQTAVNSAGKIAETEAFTYGITGNYYDFYYAIMSEDGKQMLISQMVQAEAQEGDAQRILFAGSGGTSGWSKNYTAGGDAAFGGAGWYDVGGAEEAPEPCSGLLILVGAAGMYLRRKSCRS